MPYRAPGIDDSRLSWILAEVHQAQLFLDERIVEAKNLADTEPSKAIRILRLNRMKREVDNSFRTLDELALAWAVRDMRSFYTEGRVVAAAQVAGGFAFTLPHRDALDVLSYDAYDDVATRLKQVRSGFSSSVELQKMFEKLDPIQVSAVQTKSRSAVAQALLTGEDPTKIAKILAQDLWSDGVPIIDSAGREWKMETYTRMLLRTKSANAYNAGSLNQFAQEGVARIKVLDGIEHDPECASANGETWSLEYAMQHVLEHPNCRRAFAPVQGEGSVDRKTAGQNLRVSFKALGIGAKAVSILPSIRLLRSFRQTGELHMGSPLAEQVIRIITGLIGSEFPTIERRAVGVLQREFVAVDAFVESYIDPILVSTGLIKEMPLRAQLVAMDTENSLQTFVLDLAARIDRVRADHPGLDGVINRLNAIADQAERIASTAESAYGRGAIRWVEVVGKELAGTKYGEIVGDLLLDVRGDEIRALKAVWDRVEPWADPLLRTALTFQNTGVIRIPPSLVVLIANELEKFISPSVVEFARDVALGRGHRSNQSFFKEIRRFGRTRQANVSSTLAELIVRPLGDQIDRIPLLSEDLVLQILGQGFKPVNTFIEEAIDPVLYAANLVLSLPSKIATVQMGSPQIFIDDLISVIKKAGIQAYGVDDHPDVQAVIARLLSIRDGANDALEFLGRGLGGERYLDWIAAHGLSYDRLGKITSEIYSDLRKGDYNNMVDAWKSASRFVDNAEEIKRLYSRAATDSIFEAKNVYDDLDKIIVETLALLDHNATIESLSLAQKYMHDYSRVWEVNIDADVLVAYWSRRGRRVRLSDKELRQTAELYEAAVDAQKAIVIRVEELDGAIKRRARRQLNMAAPSGPDFPSEAHTLWNIDQFDEAVTELETRLARVVPQEEILDEKILESWKEFFNMLTFDEAQSLKDEFIEFGFIKPKFTDDLSSLVVKSDIDTPEKVFTFWLNTLLEVEMDPNTGRLLSFGDELTDFQVAQVAEVLGWFDHERYFRFNQHVPLLKLHWNPQVLTRHLLFAPLGEPSVVLGNLWRKLVRDISVQSVKGAPVPNPYRNIQLVLEHAYGGSLVTQLGETGINGVLFTVTDPNTGVKLVIKRIESGHAGGIPEVLTSGTMSEFFAARLAGAEVIPTKYISLTNNGDEVLLVMPFFEGDQWVKAGEAFIDDTSVRRFSLLDRLTLERDAHPGNYLVDKATGTSVALDRESSFALFRGVDLVQDNSDMGLHGAAQRRVFDRAEEAWLKGDDFRFNLNDPEVALRSITSQEVEALTGYSKVELENLIKLDASGYKSKGQRLTMFRETGVLINDQGEAFIPTGRVGMIRFTSTFNFPEFHISHFLTESEFKFVGDLVDEGSSLRDDAVKVLKETFDDLSDETKILFVDHWGADDFDDALERAVKKVFDQAEDRTQALLDGGVINGSGGLQTHVDAATGNTISYGEVVRFTDKETGEVVEGLVVNLFEASLEEGGDVSAVVFPKIGLGLNTSEIGAVKPKALNLSEWSWGDVVPTETPRAKLKRYQTAIDQFQTSTDVDPKIKFNERLAPVIDGNGIHTGFRTETVGLDREALLTGQIYLRDSEGGMLQFPANNLAFHPRLENLIEDELEKIPSQFRPKTINVSLNRLVTEDGKSAFGMFDPDTGELHISLSVLFDSDRMTKVNGSSRSFNLAIDGSIGDLVSSDWIDDLNWDLVESVLRHELGHAVEIGQERQTLSLFGVKIFDQLQGSHPSFDLNELETLAEALIPDGFDVSQFDSSIGALIAHRAGVLEDVVNTNLVFEAKDILESGVASGELPVWARAVYAGILREEPEAHHELYAEIWKRVTDAGGGVQAFEKVAIDLGMVDRSVANALEVATDRLVSFLTRGANIEIPTTREWEMGTTAFQNWLTRVLTPDATRLIPLEKNLNRRLWVANRYSVPDIRIRVLHTVPEKGGGGITINLVTGEEPKKGFSVAKKSNEQIHKNVTSDAEFDKLLEDYVKEFKKDLDRPEWELGIWVDSNGTIYMDTVKVFDDEIDAAVFGFREQQLFMYRLDGGIELRLLEGFEDIDKWVVDYLVRNKLDKLPYGDLLSNTRKIGGVTKITGTGADKVAEEFFETGGTFRVMSTEWMTDADREKVFKALRERYSISMSVEQGKANLETVLERGLDLFEKGGVINGVSLTGDEVLEEFSQFYRIWRDSFIEASAGTVTRRLPIPVEAYAAAGASMSPSMRADINLATVLGMADIISRDLRMTRKFVEAAKTAVLKSADLAHERSLDLSRTVTQRASDVVAEAFLRDLALRYKVNQRVAIMDSYMRVRAIQGIAIAEGKQKLSAPRNWAFIEKSAMLLYGELTPAQGLLDTKVRPFFNNIIDPGDVFNTREVTIDFVMANAYFFVTGMNNLNHVTPKIIGIQAGLRPVISDTLRVLMDEGWRIRLGITSDLELQSIIWNLFRYGEDNGWWTNLPVVKLK